MDPITIIRNTSAALMALITGAFADASATGPEDEMQGIDLVQLLRRHEPTVPPLPLPEGALVGPEFDPYQPIRDLSLAIERWPDDPAAYEFRADMWERLGWPQRAKRDRAWARILRTTAESLP